MRKEKYILGKGSTKVYNSGIAWQLKQIVDEMLTVAPIDFTLTSGLRTAAEQFELFKIGRRSVIPGTLDPNSWIETGGGVVTNCDGHIKKSWHQSGFALDVMAHVPGRPDLSYDKIHMAVLIGAFITTANALYSHNVIDMGLRSGADWDRDTQFLEPGTFIDMPHLELIKP